MYFGGGAAATLINEEDTDRIGAFPFGTDGAEKLIVRGNKLFMDGPEIFNLTLDIVSKTQEDELTKNAFTYEDIDFYEFLRRTSSCWIRSERLMACLETSSTWILRSREIRSQALYRLRLKTGRGRKLAQRYEGYVDGLLSRFKWSVTIIAI